METSHPPSPCLSLWLLSLSVMCLWVGLSLLCSLALALSLFLSLSAPLPESQSLHERPWGCGQHAEPCQLGGGGEHPQGGGSRSATHPAYQTALGEGRGGEREAPPRTWTQSSGCLPIPCLHPLAHLPSETPQRWRKSRGWEGNRETKTRRDGGAEREAGGNTYQDIDGDRDRRRDTEKRWEIRESCQDEKELDPEEGGGRRS